MNDTSLPKKSKDASKNSLHALHALETPLKLSRPGYRNPRGNTAHSPLPRLDPTHTQPGADRKAKVQRRGARRSGRWRKRQRCVQLTSPFSGRAICSSLTSRTSGCGIARDTLDSPCGFPIGALGHYELFTTLLLVIALDSLSHSLILVTLV